MPTATTSSTRSGRARRLERASRCPRELRTWSETPILILSAVGEEK